MNTEIIKNIVPFLFAGFPVSLVIIKYFNRLTLKHHPKLGQTTTICTNITGTLTEKSLIVRSILFDRFKLTAQDHSSLVKIEDLQDKNEILIEKIALQKDDFINLMAICANFCHYEKIQDLESVMKKFFHKCGFNQNGIQKEYQIISKLPTDERKKISTVVATKNDTKEIFSFSKGQPGKILEKCNRILLNNKKIELTPNLRRKIKKQIEQLEKNGQKTIAFSYKGLPLKRFSHYSESFAENEMIFIGLIGLTNAIKKNIIESTEKAINSGIKTYIISGEKEKKAVAIGRILKLINTQYFECITGTYLKELSNQKVDKMLGNKEKDFVFAELDNQQKNRIMHILKKQGEKVAIATPNNTFKDIVEGIEKGRLSNKNYTKYTRHAISLKITLLLLFLGAIFIKAPLPLTITLIIALDLIVNLTLETALKQDKTTEEVMTKTFNPMKNHILTKKNLKPIFIDTIIMTLLTGGLYVFNLFRFGWVPGQNLLQNSNAYIKASSILFVFLAIYQIVRAFYLKSNKNPYLNLVSIIAVIVIYIALTFTPISSKLHLLSLSALDIQILAFSTLIVVMIQHLRK